MVRKRSERRALPAGILALAAGLLVGCGESSSSDSGGPPEDPKIQITAPTSASAITVHLAEIELSGRASIDAWSYAREVEPNVRWINTTSGSAGEAFESVEWLWFFGYFPVNHVWSAPVPLVPGVNDLRIEAYYSTSGTTVGSDTIRVTYD